MALNIIQRLRKLTWTRDKSGNNWYTERNIGGFEDIKNLSNLKIAQNHAILTPAMLFVSKIFSQADFKVVHKDTGKERKDHWVSKLLNKPNLYQTKSDFLESCMFIMIAQGKAVGYLKKPTGFKSNSDTDSIYLLDSDLIKWSEKYKSTMFSARAEIAVSDQEIIYDKDGENLTIKIKDLIFFYDLPNMLSKNFYNTRSRIDGLKQTLQNTNDSLIAKNIILKTNGKELISAGSNSSFPLAGDDKSNAESLLQNNYGLGWFRKRGIVTKANVNYQSLHIALRDLGLDESVKVDGNLIYTGLHIPKDIMSLEAKKTTYNNFNESMTSYIQNEIKPSLDSFCEVISQLIDNDNLKLVGSYEHLPIMQHVQKVKYEAISFRAKALNDLLLTGIPQKEALELCGFDKNLTLEEIQVVSSGSPKPKTTEDEDEEEVE